MLRLDLNFFITIVNLLILCFIVKKFLLKPVLDIMQKREDMIKKDIEEVRNTKAEADELKAQYDSQLERAQAEAKDIVEKSRKQADNHYQNTVDEANKEAKRIIGEAQSTAQMQTEKALQDAKSQIAELAVDMVAKFAMDVDVKKASESAYDEFLKEAGDVHDEE